MPGLATYRRCFEAAAWAPSKENSTRRALMSLMDGCVDMFDSQIELILRQRAIGVRRTAGASYPVWVVEIRQLTAAECRQYQAGLAEVLLDCVQGGASVSFMASFSKAKAEAFFAKVAAEVELGNRILLAAFLDGEVVGAV